MTKQRKGFDMKEWEFYYTETNYGVIVVEAKTEKQARKLAQQCVDEGDVSWGDSEHEWELAENVAEGI